MSEDGERMAFQGPDGGRPPPRQGPRGPQGNQGNMGNQGNPGRSGNQGQQGQRGQQGLQGQEGERGAAGLSRPVRRALVFLFALSVALAAFSLFWTVHEVGASRSAIQAAQHREQVSQQRADALLGQRLCMTFGRLAALKPPAGNPATNPSRAYLQAQHDTLAQLGTDLGCKSTVVPHNPRRHP